MRVLQQLIISLVAAAAVHARPQDSPDQPATPTFDPSVPVDPSDPVDPSAPIAPVANNLPGFCPSDISQDTNNKGHGGGGDCRCGQYLGIQVADAETDAAQPLAAAPDWSNGDNCGCLWDQNQCGCYDGVSGGDGWLYGGYGIDGGLGGDGNKRCTVSVTETVPFPVPQPTNPGFCGGDDRYCTVTVTVSVPGQPVTVPGEPIPVPVPGPTVTVPGQPGQPVTVTVPGQPATTVPAQPRPTTVTVTGGTVQSGSSRVTTVVPGSTGRPTTGFSVTGGGGGGTSTSRQTIVTVNAAPMQTGVMALGAMFGGAAMLVNM